MSNDDAVPRYLLRVWGRDRAFVEALRTPDLIERDGGPLCYWFETPAARAAFESQFQPGLCVVHGRVDPSIDDDGHPIDTRALTMVVVTLRLPDGRCGMFKQSFGYGYPKASAEHMWREGNYSCDCNKRLFLARECGIDPEFDDEDHENPCGDFIELTSIDVVFEPLDAESR